MAPTLSRPRCVKVSGDAIITRTTITCHQSYIDAMPFHLYEVLYDIGNVYWAQRVLVKSVLVENGPVKPQIIKDNQVPFMNSELWKATNQIDIWRNKHYKNGHNKSFRSNLVALRYHYSSGRRSYHHIFGPDNPNIAWVSRVYFWLHKSTWRLCRVWIWYFTKALSS